MNRNTRSIRRPSPALVISLVALFAALGGTSYAVATNSIDSREIKNGTIQGKDLKKRSIQGTKIQLNKIGGNAVKESTLGKVPSAGTADSAANAGRANTAGSADNATNAANAGALGGTAAASYAKDFAVFPTGGPVLVFPSSEDFRTVSRTCPEGQRIVTGGYFVSGDKADDVTVTEDRPSPDGRTWIVSANEINPTNETWVLAVRVVCTTAS
ncbi:MAG: hypothetical protein ACR2F4_03650 [Thermoleophilaceae bacterium]